MEIFEENHLNNLLDEKIEELETKINICQPIKEYEECIICFEDIIEVPQNYKFICDHKNNMHEECIKDLTLCPICRKITMEEAFITIEPNTSFSSLEDNTNEIIRPAHLKIKKLFVPCAIWCSSIFIILFLVIIFT